MFYTTIRIFENTAFSSIPLIIPLSCYLKYHFKNFHTQESPKIFAASLNHNIFCWKIITLSFHKRTAHSIVSTSTLRHLINLHPGENRRYNVIDATFICDLSNGASSTVINCDQRKIDHHVLARRIPRRSNRWRDDGKSFDFEWTSIIRSQIHSGSVYYRLVCKFHGRRRKYYPSTRSHTESSRFAAASALIEIIFALIHCMYIVILVHIHISSSPCRRRSPRIIVDN